MNRPTGLKIESLERRDQPAMFGTPWPNAGSLTMSFVPDNTVIAGYSQDILGWGQPSRLFNEMSGAGTTAQWQTALLRAFQTWAVNANINLGLVPDAGSPYGPGSTSPGAGSSGDIRVGAYFASPEVIAINQPYNLLSGAWSGDVLFNTAKDFSLGAQTGKFDLFTVAMHEAGNVLGLADRDTDTTSALYGSYFNAKTGLNAADVSALQALYGARTADAYDTGTSNNSINAQTVLTAYASPTDSTKKLVSTTNADLTTLTDVDHYEFKVDTTSITVRLGTVGKSLLNAKVSVYDENDNFIATATSAGPQSMQDLVLTVNGLTKGKFYTVKVEKASNDVFGIGKYDLRVGYNFDPGNTPASAVVVNYTSDAGTNETLASASTLSAVGGSANKMYVRAGRIESAADVDFYRFNSPSSTPVPLTITIDPAVSYSLYTKVTVYDNNGAVVPSQVLANDTDGHLVAQVMNPNPSKAYFLKVESAPRNGIGATGNYTLTVDFTQPAINLSTVAGNTLTASQTTDYTSLSVPEAKMFHFTLGATSTTATVTSGVRMVIYDANGVIVATMTAEAGTTTSGAIFLNQGTYTVKFKGATKTGVALTNLSYSLKTVVLSDPIDVYDPTLPPPPPTSPPPDFGTGTYTGPVLWDPWLDPWSNP